MLALVPLMLERVGILIIIAFMLSMVKSFRHMVRHGDRLEKIILTVIFGAFGIISNYIGVEIQNGMLTSSEWHTSLEVDGAIANTRIMGVTIGGFLGGPMVGIGAGLIAGLHRLTLGGFSAVACSVSTVLAGFVTGLMGKRYQLHSRSSPWLVVATGISMEIVQMGIILLLARPYEEARRLVEIIALPMITVNGFGTLVFMLIIRTMLQEEERTRAIQTHKAMDIAYQTLPYFRKGLTVATCGKVAEILLRSTAADAVAITDRKRVLAHVGAGSDHHVPGQGLGTKLTKAVLAEGRILKATSQKAIGCFKSDCPLKAAVVLPLIVHGRTAGTLKLYFTRPNRLNLVEEELAEGLSKLFSAQLEFAEMERQSKLLKDAEIKALQAQIHPHFLFNAINTISSLIRTDAERARKLLIKLAVFFRSNLQGARQMFIPLEKELEHVEAYLALAEARFSDRCRVEWDVDPALKDVLIPPFILQPLVENAVKHAFPKANGQTGTLRIRAYKKDGKLIIAAEDDGRGIDPKILDLLGRRQITSSEGTGTALWNIKKRVEELYGSRGTFSIESRPGRGTKVRMTLPLHAPKRGNQNVESGYR